MNANRFPGFPKSRRETGKPDLPAVSRFPGAIRFPEAENRRSDGFPFPAPKGARETGKPSPSLPRETETATPRWFTAVDNSAPIWRRPKCSTPECGRPTITHPDWDPHRPIQWFLPPADMCAGHGEIWVVGQALAADIAQCGEIPDAIEYARQAFDAYTPRGDSHYLYRLWGADHELLYVGETCDITRRLREHAKSQPWWHEVRGHTHEPFRTAAEAKEAERLAIHAEHPAHNIAHSPKELTRGTH